MSHCSKPSNGFPSHSKSQSPEQVLRPPIGVSLPWLHCEHLTPSPRLNGGGQPHFQADSPEESRLRSGEGPLTVWSQLPLRPVSSSFSVAATAGLLVSYTRPSTPHVGVFASFWCLLKCSFLSETLLAALCKHCSPSSPLPGRPVPLLHCSP